MRKFTFIACAALSAAMLSGCAYDVDTQSKGELETNTQTTVSLTAGIVNDAETRTDFTDPANPVWSEGDAIGVHFTNNDLGLIVAQNVRLDGTFDSEYRTATFAGSASLNSGEYSIYGYYPYGETGDNTTMTTEAMIEIPATQRPTAMSFDPMADVMVMKPLVYSHTSGAISEDGLQFKRALGMIKIVLDSDELGGEAIEKLTFTTDDPALQLTGKANFDLNDGAFGGFFEGATTTVTAEPAGDIFANGTDAILLCVPVLTIGQGTTMTISGETAGYTFTKAKTLDTPIELVAGNYHTMRVPLAGADITPKQQLSGWARSNIVWVVDDSKPDGGYLTFAATPADNADIPANSMGVFFQGGSLVAISPVGEEYTPSAILFSPTGISDYTWANMPSLQNMNVAPFNNNDKTEDDFATYNENTGYDEAAGLGDICRYISGKGWVQGSWRLPTHKNILDLVAEGSVVNGVAADFAAIVLPAGNNNEFGFYQPLYGRFLGAGVTADDNIENPANGIFLPPSGQRLSGAGKQGSTGSVGYYWTGSSYSATANYYVDYYKASSISAYNSSTSSRKTALPIRCIHE